MGNHLNKALSGICEGDPLSPPEGEAAQGGMPPRPPVLYHFSQRILHPVLLHGASPDEAASARGFIVIQSSNFWQLYYRADKSTVLVRPGGRPAAGSGRLKKRAGRSNLPARRAPRGALMPRALAWSLGYSWFSWSGY